ncbi:MAG: D-2-hydroxyacid dehydrogenase [Pirellulaceae bacterium]|jgi:phosphoglycerate dehydrogenase-like enzyme|nr:D-2-hydroxyacid dehydrogenase [Pirellulaceae bacterium]
MTTNIVLCYPVEPRHLKHFAERFPDARVIDAGQEGIGEEIFQADIFVGHAKVPVDWQRVVEQGRLKLIQSSAAGLDHCLVPAVVDSDIPVCSASGLFAHQVGEQTLALLLGLLRGLPVFFRQAQAKEFIRRPTDDLRGKRVGIVGLGGNGRRLVQLLAPFGVSLRATDYYPVRKPPEVFELWGAERLQELASVSDILILSLPLNTHTRNLISEDVLRAMPRGGYLINVARGQVVDEQALVGVLQDGHLVGAGLDVTYVEPLPVESPLWDMSNVIITPHVGAQAASRVDDSTRLAVENLSRFFRGEQLWNIVDKKLGFPHPDVMAVNQ